MGFASMMSFGIGNKLRITFDNIWFTPEGWRFATMENPVIDQKEGWEQGNRFSDEEINFLLAHFRKNVPVEWEFMLAISEMIRNGVLDDRAYKCAGTIILSRFLIWIDLCAELRSRSAGPGP